MAWEEIENFFCWWTYWLTLTMKMRGEMKSVVRSGWATAQTFK